MKPFLLESPHLFDICEWWNLKLARAFTAPCFAKTQGISSEWRGRIIRNAQKCRSYQKNALEEYLPKSLSINKTFLSAVKICGLFDQNDFSIMRLIKKQNNEYLQKY